jgi:hypothetical protein
VQFERRTVASAQARHLRPDTDEADEQNGQSAAEPVEGRDGTERNASLQSTNRTQSREIVSQAQARIRKAKERFDVRGLVSPT